MSTNPVSDGGGFKLASGPTPSTTPPVPEEKKAPTKPPFPLAEGKPAARVRVGEGDTPVAILGFSGSGKTVYLTMLYYATAVANFFGENWEADYLTLEQESTDGFSTESYLKRAYKGILGIGPDGKLMFEDPPLNRRVKREFPKGTDEQSILQFTLTRSTGIRDHVLKVKTLDVKGEALRMFASNPADPTKEELQRSPQLALDYQRWGQLRELCRQSGAILLFFNLLNWEGYDHTADVNTLVGLLINQPKPPKAIVFVVTGIDVLDGENEIEQRRQMVIDAFSVAIKRLESRKVKWEVFMISNFGRGFTRKVERLPPGHPCSGKAAGHVCNRCQELVPEVDARPKPQNLAAPWEFLYEELHSLPTPIEVVVEAFRLARQVLGTRLAAIVLFLLIPLGYVGWNLLSGWQQNQRLEALLNTGLTEATKAQAFDLDRSIEANKTYQLFAHAPDATSDAPQSQLHRLRLAAAIFDNRPNPDPDPAKSAAERLKAAQTVLAQLKPPFTQLVPLSRLQLDAELTSLQTGAPLERLAAANKALGEHSRAQDYGIVVAAVDKFLTDDLLKDLKFQYSDPEKGLQTEMRSGVPKKNDYTAYLDYLRNLQAALERGEVATRPPAQQIRALLPPMIEDFTTYIDFVKIATMPEQTTEQMQAKGSAALGFVRDPKHKNHPLLGAAGELNVQVQNQSRDQGAESEYKQLPSYDSDKLQKDFPLFADTFQKYDQFVKKFKDGPRVTQVREFLDQMRRAAAGTVQGIADSTKREYDAYQVQDPQRTEAEWQAEVNRTQANIQALESIKNIVAVAQAKEIGDSLATLLQWKRAYLELTQLLAVVPQNDKQIEDQGKTLASFIQKQPADVPARRLAVREQSRLEDTLLANQIDAKLAELPKPEKATLKSPDTYFQTVLANYDDFLKTWNDKLSPAARKQRFQKYLADTNRRDPLKAAEDSRARIVAKQTERTFWVKISESAQKRRNPADKQVLVQNIKDYLERYPNGEGSADAQDLLQKVQAWEVKTMRYKVDIFDMSASGAATLKVTVRTTEGSEVLVTRSFPVSSGRLTAPTAELEFNWNNAQDIELEAIVTSANGQEIYKETSKIPASQIRDVTRMLPAHNGVKFKLAALQ